MYVTVPENSRNMTPEARLALVSANENFARFRAFHQLGESVSDGEATLRGDYYFSQFSLDLIPVDSVEITDEFARILREDASGKACPELPSMSFEAPGSIADGKRQLERQLKKVCHTENAPMRKDLERVVLSGGKRLRPLLSLVSYRLGEGGKYPILPLMVMTELMHCASLIHDDVVDQGQFRRNVPTINVTSGNQFAVCCADFILGRAMELLKVYRGSGIDERLAQVSEQMCIGELEQMTYLNRTISEEIYYSLIEKKTALFLEAAAACGAIAGGCRDSVIQTMERFGYHIGIAFQIKDDILDFTGTKVFGKETGQDAKKGLMTLPSIIGLEEAQQKVQEHSNLAIEALRELDEGAPKQALLEMAIKLEKRVI